MSGRRLVLVRHAKAEAHGGVDAARRLAPRGVADAAAVGRWLAAAGVVPDVVVVSPARRAGQTWKLAGEQLAVTIPSGAEVRVRKDPRVYEASVEDLLAVVHETSAGVGTLALVGHNPSIAELATFLDDGTAAAEARGDLALKYPTSGIALLAVEAEWSAVAAGAGRVLAFAAPRG